MQDVIRSARAEDADVIAFLLQQLGYERSGADVARHLGALGPAAAVLVAAPAEGRVRGCIQVIVDHRLAEGRRGEITGLVVDAAARGQGTGARLVQAAGAWLASRGIQGLRVRCNVRRNRAHRFYESLGFRLTKTQNVFDIPVGMLSDGRTASS